MFGAKSNSQEIGAKLNSQETAIGFYEKLGFKVSGLPFSEAGIIHKKMIFSGNNKMKR